MILSTATLIGLSLVILGMIPALYVNEKSGDATLSRVFYLVFWFSGLSCIVMG